MVRIIWIAWHQGLAYAPPLVKVCIQSWVDLNPDWVVNLVVQNEWSKWLSGDALSSFSRLKIQNPAHQADWLRLQLLSQYGGVWADSTALCRQSLSSWLPEYAGSGFFAFQNPGPDRIISNWFLMAASSHPLVTHWIDKYEQCLSYSRPSLLPSIQSRIRDKLLERLKNSRKASRIWCHPLTHLLTAHLAYFTHHYAFAEMIRCDPGLQSLWNDVPSLEAGPCHWLQWHAHEDATSLNQEALDLNDAPMFKLSRHSNTLCDPLIALEIGKILDLRC